MADQITPSPSQTWLPDSMHVEENAYSTHRYGSQADFQASPTLFYSDVVIMPNREALFQEYVSAR